MVLSNTEIHNALDDGRLVISPEPAPRLPSVRNGDCPYDTCSVNLTLGNVINIPKKGRAFSFDLRRGGVAPTLTDLYEKKNITETGIYSLDPNNFIIANTREKVELPIQKDKPCLAGRIEGRSSFARCGLIVHFTAPTIHPGFSGTITLEMINLGAYSINLYPGIEICQLILEEVKGIPFTNFSEFHGQTTPTGQ